MDTRGGVSRSGHRVQRRRGGGAFLDAKIARIVKLIIATVKTAVRQISMAVMAGGEIAAPLCIHRWVYA